MDLINGMNRSIDYIEQNLSENIDLDFVARTAGCRRQQYTRMFPLITGISLSEYIRRRRLTVAAFELQHNKVSVIDKVDALKIAGYCLDKWAKPSR